jgi:1-acyl-sn-glycerol-3-phosphate acyltransferase
MQVQPVFLDFGVVGPEVAWIGEETAPANAFRLLTRRGSFPVSLTYLEPFDPVPLADRKAITALARERIAAALNASLARAALV